MNKVIYKPGVKAVGNAVLVRHINEADLEKEGKELSTIILPEMVKDREMQLEQRVCVMHIGPEAWENKVPRAKRGEWVLIAKYSGYIAMGKDGRKYRFINDKDIFGADDDTEYSDEELEVKE